MASAYGTESKFNAPYDIRNNTNPVVNNTDGSVVGYKYFNFSNTFGKDGLKLKINLTPEQVDGTVKVMIDSPWASKGGKVIGSFELKADMPKELTEITVELPKLTSEAGKHALFFIFSSQTKERSLCTLHDFVFECE